MFLYSWTHISSFVFIINTMIPLSSRYVANPPRQQTAHLTSLMKPLSPRIRRHPLP